MKKRWIYRTFVIRVDLAVDFDEFLCFFFWLGG